ncbi:MAG: N-acetyltransferase [Proteobacteria bacterium]|nr:MAG: N-acetyltransferase [Pseudomonadota bacterium]
MNAIQRTYHPLRDSAAWEINLSAEGDLSATRNGDLIASAKAVVNESLATITWLNGREDTLAPWLIAEHLLNEAPEVRELKWQEISRPGLPASREEFFQYAGLWLSAERGEALPERWIETNGRAHPKRPVITDGVKYRRYFPAINATITYRPVVVARDLDILHEWHNQPRVYEFWELNKPKEELREYFTKGRQDPHQTPFLLEINDEPVGYFEFYWCPEDRLGPYYDYQPFDRGFHFLIGSRKHLGLVNTDTMLKSLCHFLFLDDPRTRRIMAEPRSDNRKVLRYVEVFPVWKKLKEFDFPHKRAALIEGKREIFFAGNYL